MENNLDINNIVKIETLPKLLIQLELIGSEVDKNIKDLDKLVCTEENKQEVKKRKQNITALKNAMETKRKEIKNKLLEPYEVFNEKYESEVKGKLVNAENTLNEKINFIETQQKLDKENVLREFANEYFVNNNIQDIVTFEQIGLNITLSASEKSLKDQVVAFCERIANEVETIMLEDYKDEIFVEYKKSLNYVQAKKLVLDRHLELQKAQEQMKKQEEIKEVEQKIVENVELVAEPIEVKAIEDYEVTEQEETYEITFTIIGTKDKIVKLKNFLKEEKIEWK